MSHSSNEGHGPLDDMADRTGYTYEEDLKKIKEKKLLRPEDIVKIENIDGFNITYYAKGTRVEECIRCHTPTPIFADTNKGCICKGCIIRYTIKCERCGNPEIGYNKKQKYCKDCSDKIKKQRSRDYMDWAKRISDTEKEIGIINEKLLKIDDKIQKIIESSGTSG